MHFKFITIIARQEWASIFRSKIPLGLFSVLLIVSLLATFTGWQYVSKFNHQQKNAHQQVHDQWMSQPNRHPHRVAHYGYMVFREKSPLSFFDFGLDSYVGNSVFLEAHRQNTVNMSEAGFSNGMLRFGELSMAMVLQLLVPLFIIFIGFQTVAGLKQNGVLKILLCQKASYLDILVGKTAGLTAVVWASFLPLLLVSLIAGNLLITGEISGETLLRLALLTFLYALYFLIITILVVAVSAVSKSSKNALMVLVLIWMLFFIVIPKTAQTLGGSLYEAPDKIAFEQAIEQDVSKQGDSHNPDDPYFAGLKANTLKKYGVDSISALPVNYGALVMQEGENISSNIFNKHFDRLISIYKSQNAISSVLGFIDPYMAIRNISMNLSGTDFDSFTAFQKQTEKYRFEKTKRLNEIHLTQIKYQNDSKQKVSAKNWQEQRDFAFQPLTINQNLTAGGLSLTALLAWVLAGFGALTYVSSKRAYQL
ncbi:ABC transporter permease [Dyadobacter sp. 32]|uniref:ABC transporter permease n=1 Tax=Dyadobacter sp. 32 TaxID=538966 RepID=UPI0011EFDD91